MHLPTRVSTVNSESARQEILHRLLAKHHNENDYKMFHSEECGTMYLIAMISSVQRKDNASLESTEKSFQNEHRKNVTL
jgi:hypothetical protein